MPSPPLLLLLLDLLLPSAAVPASTDGVRYTHNETWTNATSTHAKVMSPQNTAPTTDYPPCFTEGVSWQDDMSEVIIDVPSAYECQELCQAKNHFSAECVSFTWFGPEASPFNNACGLYPHIAHEISCSSCVTGPPFCTCSSDHACSLDNDVMVDIVEYVAIEVDCQEVCRRDNNCNFYTWFNSTGSPFKDACILLSSCKESNSSFEGCKSGPQTCGDVKHLPTYLNVITSPNYPSNYDNNINVTWVATASKHTEKIEFIVEDFDSEGGSDLITLTDADGTELMRHGGHSLPDPEIVRSVTDQVTINFRTDQSSVYRGFLLKWRVIY